MFERSLIEKIVNNHFLYYIAAGSCKQPEEFV
jgi:hypothetical protein